ncbi:hypothetical protein LXL04_020746 [Taraxacum kok-saghyz]
MIWTRRRAFNLRKVCWTYISKQTNIGTNLMSNEPLHPRRSLKIRLVNIFFGGNVGVLTPLCNQVFFGSDTGGGSKCVQHGLIRNLALVVIGVPSADAGNQEPALPAPAVNQVAEEVVIPMPADYHLVGDEDQPPAKHPLPAINVVVGDDEDFETAPKPSAAALKQEDRFDVPIQPPTNHGEENFEEAQEAPARRNRGSKTQEMRSI